MEMKSNKEHSILIEYLKHSVYYLVKSKIIFFIYSVIEFLDILYCFKTQEDQLFLFKKVYIQKDHKISNFLSNISIYSLLHNKLNKVITLDSPVVSANFILVLIVILLFSVEFIIIFGISHFNINEKSEFKKILKKFGVFYIDYLLNRILMFYCIDIVVREFMKNCFKNDNSIITIFLILFTFITSVGILYIGFFYLRNISLISPYNLVKSCFNDYPFDNFLSIKYDECFFMMKFFMCINKNYMNYTNNVVDYISLFLSFCLIVVVSSDMIYLGYIIFISHKLLYIIRGFYNKTRIFYILFLFEIFMLNLVFHQENDYIVFLSFMAAFMIFNIFLLYYGFDYYYFIRATKEKYHLAVLWYLLNDKVNLEQFIIKWLINHKNYCNLTKCKICLEVEKNRRKIANSNSNSHENESNEIEELLIIDKNINKKDHRFKNKNNKALMLYNENINQPKSSRALNNKIKTNEPELENIISKIFTPFKFAQILMSDINVNNLEKTEKLRLDIIELESLWLIKKNTEFILYKKLCYVERKNSHIPKVSSSLGLLFDCVRTYEQTKISKYEIINKNEEFKKFLKEYLNKYENFLHFSKKNPDDYLKISKEFNKFKLKVIEIHELFRQNNEFDYSLILMRYAYDTLLHLPFKQSKQFELSLYNEYLQYHYERDKLLLIEYSINYDIFNIIKTSKELLYYQGNFLNKIFPYFLRKIGMKRFKQKLEEIEEGNKNKKIKKSSKTIKKNKNDKNELNNLNEDPEYEFYSSDFKRSELLNFIDILKIKLKIFPTNFINKILIYGTYNNSYVPILLFKHNEIDEQFLESFSFQIFKYFGLTPNMISILKKSQSKFIYFSDIFHELYHHDNNKKRNLEELESTNIMGRKAKEEILNSTKMVRRFTYNDTEDNAITKNNPINNNTNKNAKIKNTNTNDGNTNDNNKINETISRNSSSTNINRILSNKNIIRNKSSNKNNDNKSSSNKNTYIISINNFDDNLNNLDNNLNDDFIRKKLTFTKNDDNIHNKFTFMPNKANKNLNVDKYNNNLNNKSSIHSNKNGIEKEAINKQNSIGAKANIHKASPLKLNERKEFVFNYNIFNEFLDDLLNCEDLSEMPNYDQILEKKKEIDELSCENFEIVFNVFYKDKFEWDNETYSVYTIKEINKKNEENSEYRKNFYQFTSEKTEQNLESEPNSVEKSEEIEDSEKSQNGNYLIKGAASIASVNNNDEFVDYGSGKKGKKDEKNDKSDDKIRILKKLKYIGIITITSISVLFFMAVFFLVLLINQNKDFQKMFTVFQSYLSFKRYIEGTPLQYLVNFRYYYAENNETNFFESYSKLLAENNKELKNALVSEVMTVDLKERISLLFDSFNAYRKDINKINKEIQDKIEHSTSYSYIIYDYDDYFIFAKQEVEYVTLLREFVNLMINLGANDTYKDYLFSLGTLRKTEKKDEIKMTFYRKDIMEDETPKRMIQFLLTYPLVHDVLNSMQDSIENDFGNSLVQIKFLLILYFSLLMSLHIILIFFLIFYLLTYSKFLELFITTSNEMLGNKKFTDFQDKRIEQIKLLSDLYKDNPNKISERIERYEESFIKEINTEHKKKEYNTENILIMEGGDNNLNDDNNNFDYNFIDEKKDLFKSSHSLRKKDSNNFANNKGSFASFSNNLPSKNDNDSSSGVKRKNSIINVNRSQSNSYSYSKVINIPNSEYVKITNRYKIITALGFSIFYLVSVVLFVIVMNGRNKLSYLISYTENQTIIDGYIYDLPITILCIVATNLTSISYSEIFKSLDNYDYIRVNLDKAYEALENKQTLENNYPDLFKPLSYYVNLNCSEYTIEDELFKKGSDSLGYDYYAILSVLCKNYPFMTSGVEDILYYQILYSFEKIYKNFNNLNSYSLMFLNFIHLIDKFHMYPLCLTFFRITRNYFNQEVINNVVSEILDSFTTLVIIYLVIGVALEILLFSIAAIFIIFTINKSNNLLLDFLNSLKFN